MSDGPVAPSQATQNPAANPLSGANVSVSMPRTMTIRLVDVSGFAILDIAALAFTVTLTLAVAFGTAYFEGDDGRPGTLLAEFLGWVALTLIALAAIGISRWKIHKSARFNVPFKLDEEALRRGDTSTDDESEALQRRPT